MTSTQQQNVVSFLKSQHEEIKRLFGEVAGTTGKGRAAAFLELRRLLAVHETAEEEVVHPHARNVIANGDSVVDARLKEEYEAKKMLAELESLDVDSAEFVSKFTILKAAVLAHAENEEQQEFPGVQAETDPARLERMARAVKMAESLAPTRPHPGTESPMANLLVGPFASMLDRARDAFRRA